MTAVSRPVAGGRPLAVGTAIVLGALAVLAWLALGVRASGPQVAVPMIWGAVGGTGIAVAACVIVAAERASVPGRLLALAAALLLVGPIALAAGATQVGLAAEFIGATSALPLALLRVTPRRPAPRLMRVVDISVAALGLVGGLALVAGVVVVAALTVTAVGVVILCAGWVLFEVTTGEDRQRLLWVVLGFCLTVPTLLLLLVAMDDRTSSAIAVSIVMGLCLLALPLTAAIAVLRPTGLDVRDVIRRVAVLVVGLTLLFAVYSGAEALILWLTGQPPAKAVRLVLVGAVAVAFGPTMVRVRAMVDEILFGGRADPVDTLARLGGHFTAGSSPQQWLDTLRLALAVPGLELRRGADVVATAGRLGGPSSVTELRIGAESVGELVVALPPDQPRPPPTTLAVLALVAGPLAQSLHAANLADQVRASRGRVVAALEEERRRMRRDLHDGLGPTLTGLAYSADAATNLVRADPDQAHQVLRDLRQDAGEAIAEVRRIVYGLRPKALDELGLVGAVRQRIAHLRAADGQPLMVTIDAPDPLPELPAAIEVAAYRVVLEAVTNVARHAGVNTAAVTLGIDGDAALTVAVHDQGCSVDAWRLGVGLTSMHERVEEIGGTLTIHSGPDGSAVEAILPLCLQAG